MENKYLGTGTYCPEDNKLRFYPFARVDRADYDRLKKAGYLWAPKQELFVAPSWTPQRENILLEFCGSIEDEGQTPEDRAADRAERFAMYREKRIAEAHGYADTFDSRQSVEGFQSENKADVEARRTQRAQAKAYNQWDKAEYWQQRTAGVIRHALYKAEPSVRRGRILRIEKDQRAHQKKYDTAVARFEAWERARDQKDTDKQKKFVEYLAGNNSGWDYPHPRTEKVFSLWYLLTDETDPITTAEAIELFFKYHKKPDISKSRWAKHYENRLTYEKAMLANEGGLLSDNEMIPGGFIGKHQILKLNRSTIDKTVTSVVIMGLSYDGVTPREQVVNIQRCGRKGYRPPTAEELEAFNKQQNEKKLLKKAHNSTLPKLINPTIESAERLQVCLNAMGTYKPYENKIIVMTSAEFKRFNDTHYHKRKPIPITAEGKYNYGTAYAKDREDTVLKVRAGYDNGYFVVVLSDKPQKELTEFKAIEKVKA